MSNVGSSCQSYIGKKLHIIEPRIRIDVETEYYYGKNKKIFVIKFTPDPLLLFELQLNV